MKLLKDYKLLIFLLLPYFKPLCINDLWEGSAIDTAFNAYRVFSAFLVFVIWLKSYRKMGLLPIFYGVYSLFTLMAVMQTDKSNFMGSLIRELSMLSLILLIEMAYCASEKAIVRAMFAIMSTYTVIQFALMLIFPNGLNNGGNESRVHFLGLDNEFTLFTVLAFFVVEVYVFVFSKKRLPYFVLFIIVGISFYMASGAGITVTLVLLLYFFIRNTHLNVINSMNAFIVGIALHIIIVILNSASLFAWFITNVLHKSLTFTSRSYIWQSAIATILQNPFWGTGASAVHVKNWSITYYSHNLFLDIGMRYGIIAIVLFIIVLAVVAVSCKNVNNRQQGSLITVCIFALLLSGLVEGIEFRVETYAILALVYYHHRALSSEKVDCTEISQKGRIA